MFRLRFTDGGELVLTEAGKKKRAGVWLVDPDAARRRSRDTSAPTRSASTRGARARSYGAIGDSFIRSSATSARSRASDARTANEILLRARLSPFKTSTELSDDEIERLAAAMHEDLERALDLR